MTITAETVDELISSGAFKTTSNGLALSDEIQTTVTEWRARITDGSDDALSELPAVLRTSDVSPDFLAMYAALCECIPDLSSTQGVVISVLLNSSISGSPPTSGVPDGFMPAHGGDAIQFIRLCNRCVVYVWRDDCQPCDTIKSTLSDIFGTDPPDDVLPIAVYGPDCAVRLEKAYEVVAGPTTLFTLDGQIDSRLVGIADERTINREIDILRERS